MKFRNIELTITEWQGAYGTRYWCFLFNHDNKGITSGCISIEEARTLQWELVKQGATKATSYNPYCPHVFTRTISLLEV